MCVRYTLIADKGKIQQRFDVDVPSRHEPLYNAAPADILPVITHKAPEGISWFFWGIPPEWAKKKAVSSKLINAPTEQLTSKTSYRNALEHRRCIIPADGFYAWKQVGKKTRIPHRFVRNDNNLFAFAGIWEEFEGGEDDEVYHTFMIITCAANDAVRAVDERMPVILTKENEKKWLDEGASTENLLSLLSPPFPAEELSSYTVSNRIDTPGENSAALINPSSPVDQHGNYSLFD